MKKVTLDIKKIWVLLVLDAKRWRCGSYGYLGIPDIHPVFVVFRQDLEESPRVVD